MGDYSEHLRLALAEFLPKANLKPKDILVVGCSTSEVAGVNIGRGGSLSIAEELFDILHSSTEEYGVYLAIQCCEHLNRALVVSAQCARDYRLTEVMVVPHQHAGGAMATTAYRRIKDVCLVETISAHAGVDIGHTLIGMHLRPVAVPVRLDVKSIGQAPLVAAKTRPKLIGGARALYEDCIK